jgi:GNAT superfamily N-acetyltransferase
MLRGTEAPPDFPVALEVREARADEAEAVAQAVCRAFDMPPAFRPWFAALARRPQWRLFCALDGREAVGGGYLYVDGRNAWLGAGGVLKEYRGRSAHRALMALRICAAIAAGCTAIVTETGEPVGGESNPSLANMMRCGFRKVSSRLNYQPPA